ncbi:hypothetical protein ACFVUW_11770 [Streptomyces xiamenensis]|uniref:hypothetical protein n=1 Tax=Streptomyces xiamenensis TaxID=408015 RepID=UPI0036EB0019
MTPTVTLRPATLPAGSAGQPLRVTLAGQADCSTVRLEWPADPAGARFIPRPDAHTPNEGWQLSINGDHALDIHRLTPSSSESLTTLDIVGLDTTERAGRLPVTVTLVDAEGRPAHTSEHLLTTDPSTSIQNFTANPMAIKKWEGNDHTITPDDGLPAGSVNLSWKGPTTGGTYYLTVGENAPYTPSIITGSDGVHTCTVDKLTASTAFSLLWEATEHATAATMVMVTNGDIEAGSLSADGIVQILGTPQQCNAQADGTWCVVAATDGMLLITLDRGSVPPGTTPTTTVSVTPSQGNPYNRTLTCATSSTQTFQAHTQLPVPKDATITLTASSAGADIKINWIPFGTSNTAASLTACTSGKGNQT